MDYPYIRAWEKMMGGSASYLNDQLARAREDRAPQNATYHRAEGGWHTMDEPDMHPTTRERVEGLAGAYK